ncbi:hypothetical protein V8G54_004597 [Vigna mungo]|uniref:Uncharacterized protein n=1 Tax=Vigna mungo TaxID=3915 RepID=A0AAQ3PCU5_VIGMU
MIFYVVGVKKIERNKLTTFGTHLTVIGSALHTVPQLEMSWTCVFPNPPKPQFDLRFPYRHCEMRTMEMCTPNPNPTASLPAVPFWRSSNCGTINSPFVLRKHLFAPPNPSAVCSAAGVNRNTNCDTLKTITAARERYTGWRGVQEDTTNKERGCRVFWSYRDTVEIKLEVGGAGRDDGENSVESFSEEASTSESPDQVDEDEDDVITRYYACFAGILMRIEDGSEVGRSATVWRSGGDAERPGRLEANRSAVRWTAERSMGGQLLSSTLTHLGSWHFEALLAKITSDQENEQIQFVKQKALSSLKKFDVANGLSQSSQLQGDESAVTRIFQQLLQLTGLLYRVVQIEEFCCQDFQLPQGSFQSPNYFLECYQARRRARESSNRSSEYHMMNCSRGWTGLAVDGRSREGINNNGKNLRRSSRGRKLDGEGKGNEIDFGRAVWVFIWTFLPLPLADLVHKRWVHDRLGPKSSYLVGVFYFKVVDDNIILGWTRKTQMFKDCMRYPRRYKMAKGFLHRWLDKEEKMIGCVLLPAILMEVKNGGRDEGLRLRTEEENQEKKSLGTAGRPDAKSGPWRQTAGRWTPAARRFCGKRQTVGWHKCDAGRERYRVLPIYYLKRSGKLASVSTSFTKNQDELPDSDSEQMLPSPLFEFEKFIANRFEKASKRKMNEKMEEIIKNYVESSTSIEESANEDVDETSEEDSIESSETE